MKLLITCLLFFFFACNTRQEPDKTEPVAVNPIIEKNKELIRRVYYEMVNQHKHELIDSFFSPNIVDHSAWEGQLPGRTGFKKAVTDLMSMFSAVEIKLDNMLAEGDMVATLETWNVTMAATNKAVRGQTMHFFRIRDGVITDEWSKGWDWLKI